jgi:hypothetical protein
VNALALDFVRVTNSIREHMHMNCASVRKHIVGNGGNGLNQNYKRSGKNNQRVRQRFREHRDRKEIVPIEEQQPAK